MERYCRCKHAEASHEAHGLSGCFWCKCKCFKYCKTQSIVSSNALAYYRAGNSVPADMFLEEEPTR